jgi:hypothetical protein
MALYRSDTGRIQVTVSGIGLDNVSWDTMEGGEIAADNQTYHPGNMGPATPAGGLRTPSDLTVTRAWTDTMYGNYVALWNAAGFTAMTVSYTPLNIDRSVTVKPVTYSGLLTSVTRPNFEAASASIVYLSLVMAPSESISQN